MTARDRLGEIEADIPLAERSGEMARHFALDHGPALVRALQAVLDSCEVVEGEAHFGTPEEAEADRQMVAMIRGAIEAALQEDQP